MRELGGGHGGDSRLGKDGETSWEKGCRMGMRLRMSKATPSLSIAGTDNEVTIFLIRSFKEETAIGKVSDPKNFSILHPPSGSFHDFSLSSWVFLLILIFNPHFC